MFELDSGVALIRKRYAPIRLLIYRISFINSNPVYKEPKRLKICQKKRVFGFRVKVCLNFSDVTRCLDSH